MSCLVKAVRGGIMTSRSVPISAEGRVEQKLPACPHGPPPTCSGSRQLLIHRYMTLSGGVWLSGDPESPFCFKKPPLGTLTSSPTSCQPSSMRTSRTRTVLASSLMMLGSLILLSESRPCGSSPWRAARLLDFHAGMVLHEREIPRETTVTTKTTLANAKRAGAAIQL